MKSSTDLHWDEQAACVPDEAEVNVTDTFQRSLEYDFISRYLEKDMTILEVGCGNGFSTSRFRDLVKHVDAFDYSEKMVERAKATFGETNCRFFHDNVLAPRHLSGPYDAVACVRVLINLRSVAEQHLAIRNLVPYVKPKGRLILVEGFREGFTELDRLRSKVGLPALEPAKINFYSWVEDLLPLLNGEFECEDCFHSGTYDYLTRVVYPLLVGPEQVRHNTPFSAQCCELARAFNPDAFEPYARVRGFAFRKRHPTWET